ncbi:MAG: AAA family ATPase [Christensenellales bacterium]
MQKETSTIHSLLGVNVIDDYESGKTKLKKSKKWNIIHDSIIFIDECSMIDSELFETHS